MNLPYNKLLKHLGLSLVFNTLIALAITAFGHQSFANNLLYSQLIGFLIWAFIDVGRFFLHPNGWPGTNTMVVLVSVSTLGGYFGGSSIGNLLKGFSALHGWSEFPKMMVGFLLMSLVAGTVITYYFVSREKLNLAKLESQEALRQASQAQLALLQSQLEPHMLFNTLANLRALITTDPQRATHMLDHLNDYLRSTLSASRSTDHALSAEFDRLRDYLELMAIRMGPRMTYTLDLPADLAALPVPPLILQSLVENAIVHGLEPHVAGGGVQISAQQQGDYLLLQVADSGVGMDAQQGCEGFGITQVRERIATRYGNLAAINFIAGQAVNTWATGQNDPKNSALGTTVQLRIPLAAIKLPQPAASA
jgi:Histidine kinase